MILSLLTLKQQVFQTFNEEIYAKVMNSFESKDYNSIYQSKIPILALNGKINLLGAGAGANEPLGIVGKFLGEEEIYRMNFEFFKYVDVLIYKWSEIYFWLMNFRYPKFLMI